MLLKECVAVFIELYRNSVTVSCVGSDFLSDWTLYTDRTPQNPQRWLLHWNTMLDQIRLLAVIDRNCNTFFSFRVAGQLTTIRPNIPILQLMGVPPPGVVPMLLS